MSPVFQDPHAVATQVHALLTKVKVKATGRGFTYVGPRAATSTSAQGLWEQGKVGTEDQKQVTCPDFHMKQVPT